ncbi:zinc-ribbon domain-containing protein [Pseudarthrobacter oxydans]|uniref:zinc-ribbon domain-containing protein n=1 Tax=Pseudarthrobacter oxydans TaxID=1671 RepID=UPI00390828C6
MRGRLPLHARIRRLETAASYTARLEETNFLSTGTLRELALSFAPRTQARTIRRRDVRNALEIFLETRAGVPSGFFERQRDLAGSHAHSPRFLCPFCAHGWVVEQSPHALEHCCLKHRLWTGPGTEAAKLRRPESATTGPGLPPPLVFVSDEVLAAERCYRELLRRGAAPPALVAELVDVVAHQISGTGTGRVSLENYAAVVSIAWMLSQPAFLQALLNPRRTYAQARSFLDTHVLRAVPAADAALRDALWLLLRPTFLWVRQEVQGERLGDEFRPLIHVNWWNPAQGLTQRPLEPFSRYLDQLELSRGTSWPEFSELYVVAGSCSKRRAAVRGAKEPTVFICAAGHVIRRSCSKVVKALALGNPLCSVCSGLTALAGYNSIAESHPWLAVEWDLTRNVLEPGDVVSGSGKMVHWICRKGHRYPATVANRARNGSGCAVCANFAVLAGTNDLATTHPALAAEWHPDLNGDVRPDHVISGSGYKFAWLCPNGHTYWKKIQKRKSGQGCSICSGRRLEAGINDLGTTHPDIAAEWHPTKNGERTPQQVTFGSEDLIYWLCPKGHDYPAPINNRTGPKKCGCPYCSHRKLWPGFNDLATQYPGLARDWAPDLNGGLTASEVLPGSCLRGWRCPFGHEKHMMFRNRLRAGGCTACPVDQRAARNGPNS